MIKKQRVIAKNSKGLEKYLDTPFFTGNGFRGKLRRICTQMLLEKASEKGISMRKATDAFHLMNAGGGSTFGAQDFEVVEEARRLNPVISVFGASLAVAGKLKTSNLIPYKSFIDGIPEYYTYETEKGFLGCSIEFKDSFVKMDDLLDAKGNAKYLPLETIRDWRDAALENNKELAAARKATDGDDKSVKKPQKETIKSQIVRNFVIRGVDFYGSIGEVLPLNDIEKGMIYKAMEQLVLENLGANVSKNFGLVNYNLEYSDGSELQTKVDQYLKPSIVKKSYKKETKSCIDAFEKWLDEITEDNILIDQALVKSKK